MINKTNSGEVMPSSGGNIELSGADRLVTAINYLPEAGFLTHLNFQDAGSEEEKKNLNE